MCHFILDHNLYYFLYTSCNNGNRNEHSRAVTKFTTLPQTVSQYYLIKVRPHKTAHFEVNHHSISLVNSNNESHKVSKLFFCKLWSKCPPFPLMGAGTIFRLGEQKPKFISVLNTLLLWRHQPIKNTHWINCRVFIPLSIGTWNAKICQA